jgi:hypothetical protein
MPFGSEDRPFIMQESIVPLIKIDSGRLILENLSNPLKNTPRLAAGMNSCLSEGVIRGTGKSPLST